MSAFVVHDLKNIVTQLSLMMQNAKRLKDNPEFQEDMLATVENSLDKMRRLMLQLRSGEAQPSPVAGVALQPVVDRVRAAAAARGRSVTVEIVDRVVARGQEQRIERVIGHLVENALDATDPGGSVTLSLSREGSQARLMVCDTGHGMSPEFVSSVLFKPFASTKAQGMGIGAYESRQYIHEIGGSMTIDSEVGRGTKVTVRLPLLETGQGAMRELHGVQ
jgi:putative PEP-CTERM system histidine kinase